MGGYKAPELEQQGIIAKLKGAVFNRSDEYIKKVILEYYGDSVLFDTKIVGVTFAKDAQPALKLMASDQSGNISVVLKREPDNAYDPNAVEVYAVKDGNREIKLGYLNRNLAELIAKLMDIGINVPVKKYQVIGGNDFNYGLMIWYSLEATR